MQQARQQRSTLLVHESEKRHEREDRETTVKCLCMLTDRAHDGVLKPMLWIGISRNPNSGIAARVRLPVPRRACHAPKSMVMVTTLSSGPDAHAPQAMTTRPPSTAASAPWRPIGDAASTCGRRHVNVPRSSTCASFRKAPCHVAAQCHNLGQGCEPALRVQSACDDS